MQKVKLTFLFFIIVQNLFGQSTQLKNMINNIDSDDYLNQNQYSFLTPIINDKDIVLLGESIHLTREFPLVRIGMIKYLNQNYGFNIIALEWGAADYWAAQDILLSSQKS